jgi:hypothetical protein
LFHGASGQAITTSIVLDSGGGNPQATGSAITYGRRYTAMTLLGIAPDDDDDGNAAAQAAATAPARRGGRTASEKQVQFIERVAGPRVGLNGGALAELLESEGVVSGLQGDLANIGGADVDRVLAWLKGLPAAPKAERSTISVSAPAVHPGEETS